MFKRFLICLVVAAGVLPSAAYALDREFYVYDGISAVENAFRYIALFFAHELYGVLVMTVGVVGLGFGFVVAYLKSNGDPSVVGRTFFALCVAMGVYVGGIAQKGNVIIYDPVANDTATVPQVPDAIVFLAGTVSSIERAAIEIANLSAPRVHADLANGTIFDVLRATHEVEPIGDDYLFRSLQNYYTDCIRIAKAVPANNLSDQTLKQATDLQTEWAKAAVPTVDTTYYDSTFTNGEVATCETIWNTVLSPRISDNTTYAEVEQAVCRKSGFSPSVPAQLVRCRAFLDRIPEEVFGQTAGTDRFALYRGMALSGAMYESAIRLSPSAAMKAELNREVVTNGMGLSESWRQLGPTVRASFIAAALTALPIMFVFLITPIWGRVLQVTLAFFAFVAVWSVIDVGLTQVTHGMAVDAFEEVRRYELGSNAFFTAPTSTMKALSIFGNARAISLALSSLLIVTVFGLSGASFGALTGNLAGGAEAAGRGAAESVVNPVGSSQRGRAAADASAFKASASLNDNQLADMEASAINGNMRVQAAGRSVGPSAAATGWSQGTRQGTSDLKEAQRIAASDMTPSQLGSIEGGVGASRDMQRAKAIDERSRDLAGKISVPTAAATDRINRAQEERALGTGAGSGLYDTREATTDSFTGDRNTTSSARGTAAGEAAAGYAPGAGVELSSKVNTERGLGEAGVLGSTPGLAQQVGRDTGLHEAGRVEGNREAERDLALPYGSAPRKIGREAAISDTARAAEKQALSENLGTNRSTLARAEHGQTDITVSDGEAPTEGLREAVGGFSPVQAAAASAGGRANIASAGGEVVSADVRRDAGGAVNERQSVDRSNRRDTTQSITGGNEYTGRQLFGVDDALPVPSRATLEEIRSLDDGMQLQAYENFGQNMNGIVQSDMIRSEAANRSESIGAFGRASGFAEWGSPGAAKFVTGLKAGVRAEAGVETEANRAHTQGVSSAESVNLHSVFASETIDQIDREMIAIDTGMLDGIRPPHLSQEEHRESLRDGVYNRAISSFSNYRDGMQDMRQNLGSRSDIDDGRWTDTSSAEENLERQERLKNAPEKPLPELRSL